MENHNHTHAPEDRYLKTIAASKVTTDDDLIAKQVQQILDEHYEENCTPEVYEFLLNCVVYRIYNAKGKVLKAMNASDVGEIVGVSGNTITSRKGNWIYIWSKEGKKISAKTKN